MKELTKAEEQVMQILWNREKCFVKEILNDMPEPKPAYNTVSTIVRILENKGFVDHEVFGKSHRYFPVVSKEAYRSFSAEQLMEGYFDASPSTMLSFFLKEKSLNAKDLDEMLKMIEEAKNKKK
jgi:predicted transcriptional regulator